MTRTTARSPHGSASLEQPRRPAATRRLTDIQRNPLAVAVVASRPLTFAHAPTPGSAAPDLSELPSNAPQNRPQVVGQSDCENHDHER